ncbi:hypothetical protein OPV22_023336 [Ensete ventricosum]|uniref:cysteine dioxygenase n=1 Tax=Ensete ventricosum TaxID=4639 RepID=A0AAV8QRS8_ENSVE|nr:hypothetical protein OPV22_023336 [Ensete ventricosum]
MLVLLRTCRTSIPGNAGDYGPAHPRARGVLDCHLLFASVGCHPTPRPSRDDGVFSKLLFGSMHIKSYDWANAPQNLADLVNPLQLGPPGLRLAKVKRDAIFTAPLEANLEAVDEDAGAYAWLEERNQPDDFFVVRAKYNGPGI